MRFSHQRSTQKKNTSCRSSLTMAPPTKNHGRDNSNHHHHHRRSSSTSTSTSNMNGSSYSSNNHQKRPKLETPGRARDDFGSLMSGTDRRADTSVSNGGVHAGVGRDSSRDTEDYGGDDSSSGVARSMMSSAVSAGQRRPLFEDLSSSKRDRRGYERHSTSRYPSWYTGRRTSGGSGSSNNSNSIFDRHRRSQQQQQQGGGLGRETPNSQSLGRRSSSTKTSQSLRQQRPTTAESRFSATTRSKSGRRTSGTTTNNNGPGAGGPYIVCAINENNAKQTSVVSFDLDAPVTVQVTKLSNGQSYEDILAYLRVLEPALVLYNEQHNSSHLTRQLLEHFHPDYYNPDGTINQNAAANAYSMSDRAYMLNAFHPQNAPPADMCTVKFIHRQFFRQTEASLFMERMVRQDSYDTTLKDEYIITSAFHALIKYSQQNLNLDHDFVDHSISINVNSGEDGKRMDIDKSTLMALEILTNAYTGKSKGHPCLISTIDCTKTSVGGRLLRSQLMAPPCRRETIEARLELVDEFVIHEGLFDDVEGCLKNLPPLDKMLAGIALRPKNRRTKTAATTNPPVSTSGAAAAIPDYLKAMNKDGTYVTLGQANKEILALISIKHTLVKLPALAKALEKNLKTERQGQGQQMEHRDENNSIDNSTEGGLNVNEALRVGLGTAGGMYKENRNEEDEESQSQDLAGNTSQQLLRAIFTTLIQPELEEITTAIEETFVQSTAHRTNSLDQKFQVCFAVKSEGDTSFLDIHRHQLMANLDDIYKIANALSEKYQIRCVVHHTAARGWFVKLSKDMKDDLPEEFIFPAVVGSSLCCTTEELYSLSNRATENVEAILYLTLDRVQDVLDVARMHYPFLARVTDAVALLDLCHGFADKITLSPEEEPWARPVFTQSVDGEGGEIVIKNGRFGIDTAGSVFSQCGPGKMIPNDTISGSSKPLTVITGINGSGKTMYIKQIAIIVLLAHCGCYVPAESAQIPITHQLFARMGMSDDQESNLSSFMVEMKETAQILANAKESSLVLFDELGRATSNEEGVAIAWAVAEELMMNGCKTFFVTHYPELTELARVYSGAQNLHLQSVIKEDTNGVDIRYSHKVGDGPCRAKSSYGVDMAAFCGFPEEILKEAKEIEQSIKGNFDNDGPFCTVDPGEKAYNLQMDLDLQGTCDQILDDIRNSPNDLASLCAALQKTRNELQAKMDARGVSPSDIVEMYEMCKERNKEKMDETQDD